MKEICLSPLHPARARLDCRRCARDLRLFDRHQRTGAGGHAQRPGGGFSPDGIRRGPRRHRLWLGRRPGGSAFRRNADAYFPQGAAGRADADPRAFLPRRNPVLFDIRPDERPHDWRPGAWRLLGLNWPCRRAAGAAAPAGAGHGDHFWRRVSGKRSGGAAGELYRHPGGLATRVYVDGLAVTSRRCGAVLDAAPLAAPAPVRLRVYRDIFRNPLLGGLYGATACIITAHFAAFTYIEPLLINLQGVPATALSGLLLLSGVSGLLGNVIAGKLIDRHLKGLIFAALLLSGGALALLGAARLAPLPFCFSGLLLALWGAGIAIVFVGLQTWLLRSAARSPSGVSHLRGHFNAAIGTGRLSAAS